MSTQPMPTAPAPQPEARIGAIGRMIGVLFNPKETFDDIAKAPTWIPPVLVLIVLSLAFSWVMNKRVDWNDYIRAQAEKNERFAQLPEDQKQRALEPQIKYTPISIYIFSVVGTPSGVHPRLS